jgi:hypothetical protein
MATSTVVTISSGGHTQNWTVTAPAAAGAVTLTVTSQTPNFAYPAGSVITGAINGFQAASIPQALASGTPVLLSQGGNTQYWLTSAAVAVNGGNTVIPVVSQTPNSSYTSAASITSPTWGVGPLYASLHYYNPVMGGLGNAEISGGGYARQLITLSTPSPRSVYNSNLMTFTNLSATNLYFIGVNDAHTAGNLLFYIPTAPSGTGVAIPGGGSFVINPGDLAVSF